jgi:hypothetical protein
MTAFLFVGEDLTKKKPRTTSSQTPSHSKPATMAAGDGRERGRRGDQERRGSRKKEDTTWV